LSLRLPVALAVIAAATVDTAVLAWLAVTRHADSLLCECFPEILNFLRGSNLSETLLELVLLLQSICYSICHLWRSCKEGDHFCVKLHEASCQWTRLLSSVFNGFDVVTSFPLIQQLVYRLMNNPVAFYPDAIKGDFESLFAWKSSKCRPLSLLH
uniref:Secreted protein n=1 Tax=Schistocephalus solidus TaxID=70667 RepID=A0A183SB12_SCHSO